MSRHLLYLESGRLRAFSWNKGQLKDEGDFVTTAEAPEEFGAYLRTHPKAHFYLLVNLPDESYALDSIPHLWGADRRALIARKARQHFPEPAMTCTTSLGREKGGRKTESLLISALGAPEWMRPWLQAMDSAEAALAGIYSTPQLNGKLLSKLGHTAPDCLLLSLFGNAMRESHLHRGQTVFSRLTPLPEAGAPAIAGHISIEAGKLHQYLIAQRRIGRDEVLPVFLIATADVLGEMTAPEGSPRNLAFTLIDIQVAARRLKINTPLTSDGSLPLFLHLLASTPPRQQFAPPALRRDFRLSQIRSQIWALGIGLLTAGSLNGAINLHQAQSLDEESQQLAQQTQTIEKHRQSLAATLPRLDLSHETLRQIIERHTELAARQDRMTPMLDTLSRALDREHGIELEKLDWQAESPGPDATLLVHGESEDEAGLERFVRLLHQTTAYRIELFRAPPPLATMPTVGDDTAPEQRPAFSLRLSLQK